MVVPIYNMQKMNFLNSNNNLFYIYLHFAFYNQVHKPSYNIIGYINLQFIYFHIRGVLGFWDWLVQRLSTLRPLVEKVLSRLNV